MFFGIYRRKFFSYCMLKNKEIYFDNNSVNAFNTRNCCNTVRKKDLGSLIYIIIIIGVK